MQAGIVVGLLIPVLERGAVLAVVLSDQRQPGGFSAYRL